MSSFADAIAVKALDSRTYSLRFHETWAIGNVPHGGIVTSNILAAVKLHFDTTLAAYKQPHSITVHLEFLRKTSVGPATITIQNIKLGRRTSTVHIVLTQPSSKDPSQTPTSCVVGYITQSNIATESGVSLPTHWTLSPPPPPLGSIAALRRNEDLHWAIPKVSPFPKFRKAGLHVKTFLPRDGQVKQSIADEWLCFAQEGERFTQLSLGYVVDTFPQIVETGYSAAEIEAGQKQTLSSKAGDVETENTKVVKRHEGASFWYPTVLLNLDVKKALPYQGTEFLFVRAMAKSIKNGRFDLEVTILDENGDLIATSTHVVLVLGLERNLERSGAVEKSKL